MLEFDSPDILLSDPNSQFSSLVEQTGASEAEHLRTLANAVAAKSKSNSHQLTNNPGYNFTLDGIK